MHLKLDLCKYLDFALVIESFFLSLFQGARGPPGPVGQKGYIGLPGPQVHVEKQWMDFYLITVTIKYPVNYIRPSMTLCWFLLYRDLLALQQGQDLKEALGPEDRRSETSFKINLFIYKYKLV